MIRTYKATYVNPKVPDPITVHSLNPLPKHKVFRAAGGNKRFKRTKYTTIRRKCIIVAKSAKAKAKAKKAKNAVVDEDLEELEELEELDDLDEDEDDEPDDEDDEDGEDDDDEDESDLEDLTVKDLRTKAREDGHAPSDIRGLKKPELIELIESGPPEDDDEDEEDDEDVEDEDDDDDSDDDEDEDDEEEDEEPAPKKSKKSSKKSKSTPSRSRTTDGKVGVQEVAAAAGTDARKLRMVLRRNKIEKDEDVGRYEWPSLQNKEVLKIIKLVKGGAVKAAQKESLGKLKASKTAKKKTTDAPRKKSSGTAAKKKRKRSA